MIMNDSGMTSWSDKVNLDEWELYHWTWGDFVCDVDILYKIHITVGAHAFILYVLWAIILVIL